ncbi:unnamed protein product, partial [Amoebophrya sp. A120]|eukprot:GSA120T00025978001.1
MAGDSFSTDSDLDLSSDLDRSTSTDRLLRRVGGVTPSCSSAPPSPASSCSADIVDHIYDTLADLDEKEER